MMYRSEIDGLRAIAVVPVILFHAGFQMFSGGFVGVDIFFVISGYLITTIIIDDIEKNQFSVANFYERRARRILPALFFVILCCIPFAWIWMLPDELRTFSQSIISVIFFASNLFFWQKSGYFSASSEEMPLLHTWSLAVEEQYYVLFPVFLILTWRFGKNRVFWIIVGLAAISLALSEWGWRNKETANFYLSPMRAWELFAGSISAFIVRKHGVKSFNSIALLGLGAIVFSIFTYDETTPFPSFYSLVPVLGTVLLILYSGKETFVSRFLSMRLIVGMGLISYSVYLWHQPVFAFAKIRLLNAPSTELMIFLCVLSILLGFLSWKYIEQPFRNKKGLLKRRLGVFSVSFAGAVAFLIIGFGGQLQDGYKQRLDIPNSVYNSTTSSGRKYECFSKHNIHDVDDWYCELGAGSAERSFAVFGDSHSLAIVRAADEVINEIGLSGVYVGTFGCIPFLAIHSLRGDQNEKNCHKLNERVFEYVKNNQIKVLILVARWTYYTDGGYDGSDFSFISTDKNGIKSKEESREAFRKGLWKTVKAYSRIGVEVVIVPQVPQQKFDAMDIYRTVYAEDAANLRDNSVSVQEHRRLQSFVNSLFSEFKIKTLSLDGIFCDDFKCNVGTLSESFYWDNDHLSVVGSKKIRNAIKDFFVNLNVDRVSVQRR